MVGDGRPPAADTWRPEGDSYDTHKSSTLRRRRDNSADSSGNRDRGPRDFADRGRDRGWDASRGESRYGDDWDTAHASSRGYGRDARGPGDRGRQPMELAGKRTPTDNSGRSSPPGTFVSHALRPRMPRAAGLCFLFSDQPS